MRRSCHLQSILIFTLLLLSACAHPITKETRAQINSKTTLAMVNDNPTAFLGQHLLVGGVVIAVESTEEGSLLEIMEWQLNHFAEPFYLDDAGRRFLVRSAETLDPTIYEPGVLVTLAGIVLGQEARLLGENRFDYPVLDMTEIHLWESPFRYGIHSNPDPSYPYFVDQNDDPHRHPYDTSYNPYPYTQYWYRNDNR
jgi:outer membrane lipoprotein